MLGAEEDDRVYLRKQGQDLLSCLPDDLLLNIVERLDIADAARTSILSKRWRLIPAMLSNIRITVGSIYPEYDGVARANAAVLSATRSLLQSRTASPYSIRLLYVQFFLGHGSIRIGQIVANTIATHKVQSTELTILSNKETERCTAGDMAANGRELCLFVRYCPHAFSRLTRLKLENLRLGESAFPNIFRFCKRLEFLRLDNCDMGFQSLLEIWVKPQGPIELSQVFHKLRLVNLADISEECDLTWTMFVLQVQGAPSLEELCIRVYDLCQRIRDKKKRKMLAYSEEMKDAGAKWESSASDLKHNNLSVLRIIGFQAEDKFVNYVTTVMESAANLKDIYLYEKPACEKCMYDHWGKDRYPRTKRQRILVSNSFSMDTHPLLTPHFPSSGKQCDGSAG